MKKNNKAEKEIDKDLQMNSDLQGVDKFPGEEKGKGRKSDTKRYKRKKS